MTFRRGDIVLVTFPYTDLSTTKARPAVVVSDEIYHSAQPDVILASLTTNLNVRDSMDYLLQDWRESGLRFPTAFKPVVVTLQPTLIVYTIGKMTDRDMTEVSNRLRVSMAL